MNQYSELIKYIRQIAEQNSFVNTVAHGEIKDAFLDKGEIYPLLHIAVDSGNFTNGSTIVLSINLTCVQQRDNNKEIVNDRFYKNDNEIDNFNETLSVLNRIWTIMHKDLCDKNIIASENPSIEKIEDAYTDRLDGWQLSFDVEIPNTTLNICNDNPC